MDSRTKKTNNKRFVRYSEGAEMYSMSVSKFMQLGLRKPIKYISQPIPTVREKPSHGICFTHLNLRARM